MHWLNDRAIRQAAVTGAVVAVVAVVCSGARGGQCGGGVAAEEGVDRLRAVVQRYWAMPAVEPRVGTAGLGALLSGGSGAGALGGRSGEVEGEGGGEWSPIGRLRPGGAMSRGAWPSVEAWPGGLTGAGAGEGALDGHGGGAGGGGPVTPAAVALMGMGVAAVVAGRLRRSRGGGGG